jgi:hypothetical protein
MILPHLIVQSRWTCSISDIFYITEKQADVATELKMELNAQKYLIRLSSQK